MTEKEITELYKVRHSLAHILAMAARDLDPELKLAIGPVIDTGFYYDFDLTKPLAEGDLKELQKKMKKLISGNIEFSGEEVTADEAREIFKDEPYKLELIDEFESEDKKLTVFKSGNFTDLCAGGHVENTKEINIDAFKIDKLAGAYWRGDEKNKMLTRVYGLAFENKDELEAFESQRKEAEKRDHRKLGKQLDLFVNSELVGPGLPLFTPRGTLLRNLLDDYVWELRKEYGYEQVDIPHITKQELYETSGHWDKFGDELFAVKSREGHEFIMKPMNCPHHTQIYDRKIHSYKELPVRYANTTKVYRDEQTGELAGLARVRSITQDDAHVFCRKDQIREEFEKIWGIVTTFYGTVGFTNITATLSLSDPEDMENIWEKKKCGVKQKKCYAQLLATGKKILRNF